MADVDIKNSQVVPATEKEGNEKRAETPEDLFAQAQKEATRAAEVRDSIAPIVAQILVEGGTSAESVARDFHNTSAELSVVIAELYEKENGQENAREALEAETVATVAKLAELRAATHEKNEELKSTSRDVANFIVIYQRSQEQLKNLPPGREKEAVCQIIKDLHEARVSELAIRKYQQSKEENFVSAYIRGVLPGALEGLESKWRTLEDKITDLIGSGSLSEDAIVGEISRERKSRDFQPSWDDELFDDCSNVLLSETFSKLGQKLGEAGDQTITHNDVQAITDRLLAGATRPGRRQRHAEQDNRVRDFLKLNNTRRQQDTPAEALKALGEIFNLYSSQNQGRVNEGIYLLVLSQNIDEKPSDTLRSAKEIMNDPAFETFNSFLGVYREFNKMLVVVDQQTRKELLARVSELGNKDAITKFIKTVSVENGDRETYKIILDLEKEGRLKDPAFGSNIQELARRMSRLEGPLKAQLFSDLTLLPDQRSCILLIQMVGIFEGDPRFGAQSTHELFKTGCFQTEEGVQFIEDYRYKLSSLRSWEFSELVNTVNEYQGENKWHQVAKIILDQTKIKNRELKNNSEDHKEQIKNAGFKVEVVVAHSLFKEPALSSWDGLSVLLKQPKENQQLILDGLSGFGGERLAGALQVAGRFFGYGDQKIVTLFEGLADAGRHGIFDRSGARTVFEKDPMVLLGGAEERKKSFDFLDEARSDSEIIGAGELLQRYVVKVGEGYGRAADTVQLLASLLPESNRQLFLRKFPDSGVNALERYASLVSAAESTEKVFDLLVGVQVEFFSMPDEKRAVFVSVLKRISETPSQALQRVAAELSKELALQGDPEAALDDIEDVFTRNNLPDVAKALRVFEILNTKKTLDNKLQKPGLSPVLKGQNHRARMFTIYKDILKVHVESSNPSLKEYLQTLQGAQEVVNIVESQGPNSLNPEQQKIFAQLCRRLEALFENSQLGRSAEKDEGNSAQPQELMKTFDNWKMSLGVQEGQSVTDRIAEMFLRPLGFESIESALGQMDSARQEADARGREFVANLRSGGPAIQAGDLLKGTNPEYFASILRNGSVAKEYLGADADSDATPLDTDLGEVLESDVKLGTKEALNASPSKGYGDVVFGIRNRGQFIRTDRGEVMKSGAKFNSDDRKYELFVTAAVDSQRHVGIRTGFPSTEIDYVVMRGDTRFKVRSYAMETVMRGVYTPILDEEGSLLFSPEDFDTYRATYLSGLESAGGTAFKYEDPTIRGSDSFKESLALIKSEKESDRELIPALTKEIRSVVTEVLAANNIGWRDRSAGLAGAEMLDTGSSARLTNVSGSYDFDFALKLDPGDMRRVDEVQSKIFDRLSQLGGVSNDGNTSGQLRMKGVQVPGSPEGVDIDIAFASKAEIENYESHNAVEDRLKSIEKNLGVETLESVTANITLAKKMLKAAKAYKKGSHADGGLGGIGVENWILANGGSVLKACDTFNSFAYDESGAIRSFEDFKKDYALIDPGINVKFSGHDNFILNMTPDGYLRMAEATKNYLAESITTA